MAGSARLVLLVAATGASARALDLLVAGAGRGWRGIAGEFGPVTVAALWWLLWLRHRRTVGGPAAPAGGGAVVATPTSPDGVSTVAPDGVSAVASVDGATLAGAAGLGGLALVGLLGSLPLFRGLLLADDLATQASLGVRLLAFVAGTVALGWALRGLAGERRVDTRPRPGRVLAVVGAGLVSLATVMPTTTVAGASLPLRPILVDADPAFAAVSVIEALLPIGLVVVAGLLRLGAAAWLVGAPAAGSLAGSLGLLVAFGPPTIPTVWLWSAIAGAGAMLAAARWWGVLDRSRREVRRRREGTAAGP